MNNSARAENSVNKRFRNFYRALLLLIFIVLSLISSMVTIAASETSQEDTDYDNMIFRLRDGDKSYYVNINGDKITDQSYVYDRYHDRAIYNKGIGYIAVRNIGAGVIDIYGREVLPCKYQEIEDCVHDDYETIFQVKSDGKYAIFSSRKGFVTTFEFDRILLWCHSDNKVAPCKKNGKWGFINYSSGIEVAPFIYTDLDFFRDNNGEIILCGLLCASKENRKWGVVSTSGKEITPFYHNYDKGYKSSLIYHLSDYELLLQQSGNNEWYKYSISNGKKIRIGNYDWMSVPVNGVAVVKKGDLYGVLNLENNKLVFPCEYPEAPDVSPLFICNNFICVLKDYPKITIANKAKKSKKGDVINKINYLPIITVANKIGKNITNSTFRLGKVWDNRSGELDMFCATDDVIGKMGAIDIKGNIAIPFIYDYLSPFHVNGLAVYKVNERYGVIDKNNEVKIPAEYDSLSERYSYGDLTLFLAARDDKFGLVSSSNTVIMPTECDEIDYFDKNGHARYRRSNQYGYVNIEGKIVSSSYDKYKNELLYQQYLQKHQPSDVDKDIPVNNVLKERSFAVIIANEDYSEKGISKVVYAHNDGEIFKKYCEQALGIPSNNIRFVKDATFNQIRSSVNWICDRAKVFDGEAELLVYYSGHGIPDEKDRKAYLMPSDGIANDSRSYYSLSELYQQIGSLPSKKSVILLDACFSGTSKEGNIMIADTKGIAIKPEPEALTGNTIVFSAAQADETAFSYKGKKHSLFTYFLLKKLQEGDGKVSLGELSTFVNKKVRQESVLKLGKLQTPTIDVSDDISGKWESLNL